MSSRTARPRVLVAVAKDFAGTNWDNYSADYARAVEAAGAEAIPIYYGRYTADDVPSHDGLVTIGGVDVDAARYGEQPHEQAERAVPARDAAEFALTRLALDEGRPLLAICRGAQVLNVACGGSLLQHIEPREPHHGPHTTQESGWHEVEVAPGSLLARIAGGGPLRVNSRHHQAVTPERLAPGLVESGRTEHDGLVILEAFEVGELPFALGVQWHPERPEMSRDPAYSASSTKLFEAFVAACIDAREANGIKHL